MMIVASERDGSTKSMKEAKAIKKANILFIYHVMIFGKEIQGYLGPVVQRNWDRNKYRQFLYSLKWDKGE